MTVFEKIIDSIKNIFGHIFGILGQILRILTAPIFAFVSVIAIGHVIRRTFPGFWNWLIEKPKVKAFVSTKIFQYYGNVAPARPHQFTMRKDYTLWDGFVDRTYTGRHIGPFHHLTGKKRPDINKVIEMFMRPTDAEGKDIQIQDERSSVLFASFAQWFTDGFLRTSHMLEFDENGNFIEDEDGMPRRMPGREKFNDSNHEIDACQIYGITPEQTKILRSDDEKGCLKSQMINGEEYPPFLLEEPFKGKHGKMKVRKEFKDLHPENLLRFIFRKAGGNEGSFENMFALGLEHSNSTIGNVIYNTLFLREHNRVARLLAQAHPDWDDDRVFDTARNTTTVLLLKIVISDYIRHISPLRLPLEFQPGLAEKEQWYRTNRIKIEFNILYRWHGLVPSRYGFLPSAEPGKDNPTAFLHNNKWIVDTGIGGAITALSKEPATRMVMGNTPNFLRGVKIDTMRLVRASNLAPYNDYRERFSLPRAKRFEDITDDPKVLAKLKELYPTVDDVEWYVGMSCEKLDDAMLMGRLLFTMVAHDAFTHALTNPLLSNEVFVPETFGKIGWETINTTHNLTDMAKRLVPDPESMICAFDYRKAQ